MANLLVKEGFTAFKRSFKKDEVVDDSVGKKWPEGALTNRITSGFFEYTNKEPAEDKPPAKPPAFDPAAATIRELVLYAHNTFKVDLSPNKPRAEIQEEVEKLIKERG